MSYISRHPMARRFEQAGIYLDGSVADLEPAWKRDFDIAMDAQPALATTPNSGIPAFLTTFVDPEIIRILFAPNEIAQIVGEARKGDWLTETAMFPMVERTGEVSSYGDRNNNGRAGVNTNFPQRQAYLYQVINDWGQREMERAGLAKIGWAAEVKEAGVEALNKFQNFTYAFGVNGLQNYGLLNDPKLSAVLTPATKANGGTAWIVGGAINATANEIYADIEAIWYQLVLQTNGTVKRTDPLVLAMAPTTAVAMTATNSFNVNVTDLLKKSFPNVRFEEGAVQYGANSTTNNQGQTGGNLVQLIAEKVQGQRTAMCAFNEKLRSHPILVQLSSYQQKMTQGSWGAIIKQPMGIAQMQGV